MFDALLKFLGLEEQEYRSTYAGAKPLPIQAATLARHFPELDLTAVEGLAARYRDAAGVLPVQDGAEGWFLVPKWQRLGHTYEKALKRVFHTAGIVYEDACIDGIGRENLPLGQTHLRPIKRTTEKMGALEAAQAEGDVLIFPAQLGRRHLGRSVGAARSASTGDEFALGIFAVACMVLVHPERFATCQDNHADCAGEDYCWPHPGFTLRFAGGVPLHIWPYETGHSSRGFYGTGTASGFVPQVISATP